MLDSKTLCVGLLDPSQLDEVKDPALETTFLDATERSRHASFRHAASQRNFLCGRLLAKSLVARRLACAPHVVRITCDQDGKPLIAGPTSARLLSVSISHTDGLVACAVGMVERLGIDVEMVDRPAQHLPLTNRVLADCELRDVLAVPHARRVDRFLQYWTLKEAWAKSVGVGLGARFCDIVFDLQSAVAGPSMVSTPQSGQHGQTLLSRVGVKHLLALSFEGEDPDQVEWLLWDPRGGDGHFSRATQPHLQFLPARLQAVPDIRR